MTTTGSIAPQGGHDSLSANERPLQFPQLNRPAPAFDAETTAPKIVFAR